ncbi:MFS transporter [Clostridium sp. C8-1-8]|uniref:MFS transporter n=1 Tax=Clostridium sp. C8-1-8 TaxID=2698831 RepID=UPI00136EDAFC|nr:MFS transporter [Clostridium sp. C8-1-8]
MSKNNNINELRNFYILQLGQFISQFGSKITSYGLIMWVYDKSGSVLSTSALTICTLLPSILLSFISGSFIDGINKKKVMLICNAVETILSVITLALLFSNMLNMSCLYLINFTFGVVDSFQDPASNVVISMIVPKKYYTKISGIRSFATAFNTTFAPTVASLLYTFLKIEAIIFTDLCTFIFAFMSLLVFVHIPKNIIKGQQSNLGVIDSCKQGLAYIINKKDIFHLIIYMAFVNLIAAIYNSNFTPMVLSRNGNNKYELGIVLGAIGVAGIFGSLLVTIMKEPKRRVPIIINSMLFSFLVCNSMLGIGRSYYVWTVAVFLGNSMVPFLTANVEYFMRTKVPVELQGRVFSARNTLQYFTIPLGYLIGGIATDRILNPFMNTTSPLQQILSRVVGRGSGAGNALIYVIIAILGFLGCCLFKADKHIKVLDDRID